MPKRTRKQPTDEMSSLAGKVLNGYEPTRDEVLSLAGAVLGHDVTPGPQDGERPADD